MLLVIHVLLRTLCLDSIHLLFDVLQAKTSLIFVSEALGSTHRRLSTTESGLNIPLHLVSCLEQIHDDQILLKGFGHTYSQISTIQQHPPISHEAYFKNQAPN